MSRLTPAFIHRKYEAVVAEALNRVRSRLRMVDLAAVAIWLAAAGLAYLALIIVLDQAMPRGLPLGLRRGLLIGIGGALAIMLARAAWIRRSRQLNEPYLAWLIERHVPKLRHSLLTALQLKGHDDVRPGVVVGVIRRCARVLRRVDAGRGVPLRRPALALRAAGAALAFLLLYAVIAPKPIGPSLLRALGWDMAAPTRTRLEWVAPTRGASVVRGSDLPVAVRIRGRVPKDARTEFSTDGGRSIDAALNLPLSAPPADAEDPRVWSGIQAGRLVRENMHARVVGGDGVSEWRLVSVRTPPDVARLSVAYDYPAYCGLPRATREGGEIDALVGTRVTLEVRADTAAAGGVLQFRDGGGEFAHRLELDKSDASRLTASWLVESDAQYRIILRDRWDTPSDRPALHRQHARPDVPPEVRFAQADAEQTLGATDVLHVEGRATDDVAVRVTAVALRRGPQQPRLVALQWEIDPPQREAEIAGDVPLESVRAAPGDVVEFRLEATDNRCDLGGRPAAQTSVTEWRRVRIRAAEQLAAAGRGRDRRGPAGRSPSKDAGDGSNPDSNSGQPDRNQDGKSSKSEPSDGGSKDDARKLNARPDSSDASSNGEQQSPPAKDAPTDDASRTPPADDARATDARPSAGSQPSNSNEPGDDAAAQPGDAPGSDKPNDLKRFLEDNRDAVERLTRRTPGASSRPAAASQPGDDGPGGPSDGRPATGGEPRSQQPQDPPDERRGDNAKPPPRKEGNDPHKDGDDQGSDQSDREASKPNDQQRDSDSRDDDGKEAGANNDGGQKDVGRQGGNQKGGDQESGGKQPGESKSDANQPGDNQAGKKGDRAQDEASDKASNGKNDSDDRKPADPSQDSAGGNDKKDSAGANPGPPGEKPDSADGSKGAARDGAKPDSGEGKAAAGQTGADSSEGRRPDNGPGAPGQAPPASQPAELKEEGRFSAEGDTPDLPAGVDRVEHAVDELERQLRAEDDPSLLKELGWDRARANRFVREFRRRLADARGGPERTAPPRERRGGELVQPGERELKPADDAARSAAAGRLDDAGTHGAPSMPLQDLPPEQVPPEYRDLLDGYYREMARN